MQISSKIFLLSCALFLKENRLKRDFIFYFYFEFHILKEKGFKPIQKKIVIKIQNRGRQVLACAKNLSKKSLRQNEAELLSVKGEKIPCGHFFPLFWTRNLDKIYPISDAKTKSIL